MNSLRSYLPSRGTSWIVRYAFAVVITAAAYFARGILTAALGGWSAFVVFLFAVGISAAWGGLGPGLLSTFLASAYGVWILSAYAAGRPADFTLVFFFAAVAVTVCLLGEGLYRARIRAGRGEAALEHSEERFRLLVENVVDYAIFLLSPTGIVTSWNAGAQRITGYSESEIVGKNFQILHLPSAADSPGGSTILARAGKEGRSQDEGWRVRKDGSRFWASVIITPLRDRSGRIEGFAKVMRDLTEQRKAEQAVLQKQNELEALNIRLRRAMLETHHRVKNSLQVISAMVDIRLHDSGPTVPAEEVRKIGQEVYTLAQVHDLLTDEARNGGDASEFSVRKLLENLLELMQKGSERVRIVVDLEDVRLRNRLATSLALLTNELVFNAIKHSKSEVRVELNVGSEFAELSVSDDGPGFPADFSLKEHAQTGLELVWNLARYDLQGEIRFENQPGGGGSVRVRFPVAHQPVEVFGESDVTRGL